MVKATITIILSFAISQFSPSIGQLHTANAVTSLEIGSKKISRRAQLPSERIHTRLARAHSLMAGEDYAGALSILTKMTESAKSRPHELAQILQTLGYVHAHMENNTAAMKAFSEAIALETLPEAPTLSTMYTLAQLQLMEKDYDAAIKNLRDWFAYTADPEADAYVLLAMAYVEKKQYQEALPLVKQGMSLVKEPKEVWLQLQVSVEFALKDYQGAASTLRRLVESYPDQKKYFKQLAAVYLTTENYKRALAVSELAYMQGFLSEESELLNLANLYLFAEIPLRAAQVLQKEMNDGRISASEKTLTLLASSWHRAQELEHAVKAYAKAGDASDNGQLYVTVGQIYAELEAWSEAASFYQKALRKGGIKNTSELELSLGIAKFHIKDAKGAIQSFKKVLAENNAVRPQAEKWLSFVKEHHTN